MLCDYYDQHITQKFWNAKALQKLFPGFLGEGVPLCVLSSIQYMDPQGTVSEISLAQ